MDMPGRNVGQDYRFGMNGKTNDDEMYQGAQDFDLRMYDNRLGRFYTVDPFRYMIHNKSNYSFAGNSPIAFIDKNGGFQMTPELAEKYPVLNQMAIKLSNMINDPSIDEDHIPAFFKQVLTSAGFKGSNGEMLDELKKIFSYGSGPTIMVESGKDDEAGWYRWDDPKLSEYIYINKKLASRTNKDDDDPLNDVAEMFMIFNLFWHEGIHFLDYCVDGINQDFNLVKGQDDLGDEAEMQRNTFGFNITSRGDIRDKMKEANKDYGIGGATTSYGIFSDFRSGMLKKQLVEGTKKLLPGKYVVQPAKITNNKRGSGKSGVTSYQNARFLD